MKSKSLTSSLVVVSGNQINATVRSLQLRLSQCSQVDLRFDGLGRTSKKSRGKLLPTALYRYFIFPLFLCFSVAKYERVITYFNRSGYLLGIRNRLVPQRYRVKLVWIGFAPTPCSKGKIGRIKEGVLHLALQGTSLAICHSLPLLEDLKHRFPDLHDKLAYVRWDAPIALAKEIYTQREDEGYIFCGGKTNRDFETVIAAVRNLDIPTQLVMGTDVKLRGPVPPNVVIHRDIPAFQFDLLMAKARIVVITLLRNEFASGQLVLKKAMLLGKPVVITNISGIDDYVLDGYNVLSIRPQNPTDLREKLVHLINSGELRQQLGQHGQETVQSSQNSETFANELVRVILDGLPSQGAESSAR